jgi:hypothetical protein
MTREGKGTDDERVQKMKRMLVLGSAVVAVFAMMAALASAEGTGPKVTFFTAKGPIKKGDTIVASSSNLIFVTSGGNLECSRNIISGVDKTNGREKDAGTVTSEESTGEEPGGLCKTTTPFGPAEISTSNLPWKDKFTNKGIAQLNTGIGTKTIRFTSTFPSAGGAKCTFITKKVISTFNLNGVVTVTTSNQVFKLEAGSTSGCPIEGKLSGSFSVTSNGEPVSVETK